MYQCDWKNYMVKLNYDFIMAGSLWVFRRKGWAVTTCRLGCYVMRRSGLIGLRRVVQTFSAVHAIAPVTATLAGSAAFSPWPLPVFFM